MLMKACCLVLADGRLTFYKLLSACFQKPTVSHCHQNVLWVWYGSRLTVMYFCLFHPFCPFDFPFTFTSLLLSLAFGLLVMLSPSPRGKVNVYLSPKGEVYSSVSPASALCPKLRREPSQLALACSPARTWLLRLGRRIGSNKRFGRGEKYTN